MAYDKNLDEIDKELLVRDEDDIGELPVDIDEMED